MGGNTCKKNWKQRKIKLFYCDVLKKHMNIVIVDYKYVSILNGLRYEKWVNMSLLHCLWS